MITKDFRLIHLESTGSTNDYIKDNYNSIPMPACVSADFQEKGKGQGKNRWQSSPGMNLLFSIGLIPSNLEASHGFYISKIMAISISEMLDHYLPGTIIKWPNDILIAQKKIAGILIENTISGHFISRIIAGAGINVNQVSFPSFSLAPGATSIKIETGCSTDRNRILAGILENFVRWYEILEKSDFDRINQTYNSRLLNFSEWSFYKTGAEKFRAFMIGVDESGQLILKTENGRIRKFEFREISHVLSQG